ncbi:hypothetical protein MPTK1_5g05570 [Marchantia polymorpha subsp. ruderalis]|uniref:RING-type domain-containing protein n=2 Tax=Marchantia polymorpha TaxID=3197 RepID=A0AAF6BF97_MARPO|nr:hypothetical protein MARPO_0027s0068 [Marchantia polymorpha]PTQ42952.1 hypothetical protein MARPO_0027s0068 [Marchantia polymorpha]BBN10681.1 hypothetical protein Mp_5g05570 [Marchantia polymorpha subsp. ruderalis]BBN10682.1 hypothetical protein Mp_5g05570 [Marchantia polymorpha subsp. ruderalis]|eukprot:PTQ42951.1 hypothetical protein MARPO_0027s0068 [Marchantia polymorpha]
MEVKQEIQDEEGFYVEPPRKRTRTHEVDAGMDEEEELEEQPSPPESRFKKARVQHDPRPQHPEALISEQLREAVEKAQTYAEPKGTEDCATRSRNERHVRFLNCITLVLQESSGFLKRSSESGCFQPSYDELRNFQCNARRLLDEVEQGIHLFRIKEIERIEAEKARTESVVVAERSKLLARIEGLRQENSNIRAECTKLELEVDRLFHEKAEFEKERVEAEADKEKHAKERTRELAKKHEEEVFALGREVVALQGKGICQMCYLNPRDGLVLPCLHLLYCYQCLEAHKLQSKACPWPSCRSRISALLLCDLTGENSTL